MASTKKPTAPKGSYQLHVALLDITPAIWRRLWIPGNLRLSKLDRVIQEAFGWTNSHLHEFRIAGERYGMTEIENMDGDEDDDHFENWNWHGGPFDPKGFDVNTTNTRIRHLR